MSFSKVRNNIRRLLPFINANIKQKNLSKKYYYNPLNTLAFRLAGV
jgi:hypothetical protein